ncbi:MAG: ATP-binding cassette domain-containing protein [Acidaminobacter sp.]|uniref:sugar ABC transporter ATP-binding protein n=1 Tax=Acidaminobacter sp. TaxID=1872102 RepID=UPI001385847A|nr:sugar ABC transporter ATP-binding protein [Acidaminobacter sp.]MZQ98780.1 ATP-binding cassette domain-containing protein [Acidaminobacter sp.]
MGQPIIEMKQISKCFGEARALDQVDLSLWAGEIHGLVGSNGSGKSTLLNILNGHPVIAETGGFSGEIRVAGQTASPGSIVEAIQQGIGMVHQEFALMPEMSVKDNLRAGYEVSNPLIDRLVGASFSPILEVENRRLASEALASLGIELNMDEKVRNLPVHLKQFVEIGREVGRDGLRLLILDEPTASMSQENAKDMMEALKRLKQKGIVILFVSHRLEEVVSLCDRVTVLRDGRVVSQHLAPELDPEKLALDMIGEGVLKAQHFREENMTETVFLKMKQVASRTESIASAGISLEVNKGEVMGLTGLAGHGFTMPGNFLMGGVPWTGEIELDGQRLSSGSIQEALRQGAFMLPDERKELGLMLHASISENIAFAARHNLKRFISRLWPLPFGLSNQQQADAFALEMIRALGIKCRGPHQHVRELSGGNQQKVCIARAIAMSPKLLFVGEPTRGMDIQSKEMVLKLLIEMNRTIGTTLIIASSELEELIRLCDRIAVFRDGEVVKVFKALEDPKQMIRVMSGERGHRDAH